MFNLIFSRQPPESRTDAALPVGSRLVPVRFVRHPRARRYLLRLLPDGTARVTVPRGGSRHEARRFAQGQTNWLERQFERLANHPAKPVEWRIGSAILS